MIIRSSCLIGLVSMMLTAGLAWADIPVPPKDLPPGKQAHPFSVRVDETKDVSYLYIPRRIMTSVKLSQANVPLLEGLDNGRSMIAALALSLGIIGMLVLRKKRLSGVATIAIAGTMLAGIAVESWANAPAPVPAQQTLQAPFSGDVVVSVVEQGFEIQLVIGTKPKPQRPGPPGKRFELPPR
jgi:hypothetical protein